MATKTLYKGISTRNLESSGQLLLTNIDIVKQDLLNHIFTEKGERLYMPTFGTRIPSLVFEPNDAEVVDIIREDLTAVFKYDPRVKLIDLTILPLPDNNAIVAIANLLFVEFNTTGSLNVNIKSA